MTGRAIGTSVALALLSLAGCAGSDATSSTGGCSPLLTCDPPTASTSYAAELIPPSTSAFGPQESAALDFVASWTAQLKLRPSVTLSGAVVDGAGAGVVAELTLTRASAIAGLVPVTSQLTTDMNGAFTVQLPADSYQLHVLPQGGSQLDDPPITQAVTLGAGVTTVMISDAPLARISGTVVSPLGAGLSGVDVRALDATTGDLLSSLAATDANGGFTIAIGMDAGSLAAIRLVGDGGGLPATLSRVLAVKDLPTLGAIELRAPALPSQLQSYTIPLLGHTTSGALTAVQGARIDVSADVSDLGSPTTATFTASTTSDDKGNATVTLVPGSSASRDYALAITPPDDSMFARGNFTVTAGPTGGFLGALTLDGRTALVGQIVDAGGAVVTSAVVSTRVAADQTVASGTDQPPLPQAVTDGSGRFLLWLEAGSYDLAVVPSAGGSLARWSIDGVAVSGDSTDLGTRALPKAASATVVVVDQNDSPVAGAEVRLYSLATLTTCATGTVCSVPRLRADAESGTDGVASMLLGVAAP